MHARKPGSLILAGILSGVALLVAPPGSAQAPASADATPTLGHARSTDIEIESLGATGALDAAALLVPVQSGGWGNSNQGWGGGWPVVCQSNNNRRRTCNKPSNQTVRIERQLSNTRCTQGVNWGQNRNQIWVDNGCSARFVPTGNWNGGGGNWNDGGSNWGRAEITCESRNFNRNHCNWPSNWGNPQLVQQISQVRCVRDRNWGFNRSRGQIWVNDGCAARFRAR